MSKYSAFSFNAYVLSVIDTKRICVRISNEYTSDVLQRLSNAYGKTMCNDMLSININKCVFNIVNIPWNEVSDLIGVQVKIHVYLRPYKFDRKLPKTADDSEHYQIYTTRYAGVSIIASRITNNMKDDN